MSSNYKMSISCFLIQFTHVIRLCNIHVSLKLKTHTFATKSRAFLGVISAQKNAWALVPAYANCGMAAESGTNACPCKVAGKGKNTSPGTMLEGRDASGTAVDWFVQVKEPSVEPATAAEGIVRAGASAAAQRNQDGDARLPAFSMKNQLGEIFGICATHVY